MSDKLRAKKVYKIIVKLHAREAREQSPIAK